jgi:hypothetical protein
MNLDNQSFDDKLSEQNNWFKSLFQITKYLIII